MATFRADETGIYLDDYRIHGVQKIDLLQLGPYSPKRIGLEIQVDKVYIKLSADELVEKDGRLKHSRNYN